MEGLIAVAHEQGLSILKNALFKRIRKFELIDSNNSVYYKNSIHSSYFDNDGVLTVTLIIPKENHFTKWNKAVRIKSDNDLIIAEVQTPAIQFVKGVGGTQEIKLAVSGKAGVINFKADEYITDIELKELYLKPINIKLSKKALLSGSTSQIFKVAHGADDNDAINKKQLKTATNTLRDDLVDVLISTGTILPFASSTVPKGFLECNGAAISRVAYVKLFNVIKTIYGVGDGKTTFNIPDLRGEFIRGWDNKRGVDKDRKIGSYQADVFASHSHSYGMVTAYDSYYPAAIFYKHGMRSLKSVNTTGGTETRPRNISMMYCIKY